MFSFACQRDDQSSMVGSDSVAMGSAATALKTVDAYPKLKFEAPVEYTYANDGTNRVFVVEQAGRIRVFENAESTASAGTYLDIRNKVAYGGEMGLLGLAFHPKFEENGFFYVNYTKDNPRETIVSRFKASSSGATQIDPTSEVILFRFNQPYSNHNGGKVAFGPDGYLYVATGDGGSGGDPQNNGQNKNTWLGKILRVDVNSTEKGQYGIPKDNPFAGQSGVREEIYAYGLRNPWRFSFDGQGRLWTGDVGQNKIEEIDIVTKGGNYGWRIKEADQPFNDKSNTTTDKLIDPIHEYQHGDDGNSVTGGYVYEGKANPSLRGKYIFGDFGSGRLWALTYAGGSKATNQLLINRAGSISAFGEDASHELYICDYGEGKILKLTGM
jgi:glucose/arabinose dehydrogenase